MVCVANMAVQRDLRSSGSRPTRDTLVSSRASRPGVTSSASAHQLSVDGFQRSPQKFSASATRLYVNDGPTTVPSRSGDAASVVSLRRRDVAHRGSLMSLAVLIANRRSSCPVVVVDERSMQFPVGQCLKWFLGSYSIDIQETCCPQCYFSSVHNHRFRPKCC